MSGLGASLASITPDQKQITLKNKRKETSDISILRKEPIPKTVNPRKRYQGDSLMPTEKESQHKISQPFQCKEEYEGDTDEKNNEQIWCITGID